MSKRKEFSTETPKSKKININVSEFPCLHDKFERICVSSDFDGALWEVRCNSCNKLLVTREENISVDGGYDTVRDNEWYKRHPYY